MCMWSLFCQSFVADWIRLYQHPARVCKIPAPAAEKGVCVVCSILVIADKDL